MGANSLARRFAKRVLHPLVGPKTYGLFQAAAVAWDIRSGGWSEPELSVIPLAVKPGDTVIDVGANYGQWVYHLSRAVGPTGKVHAFEPIPFTFATMERVTRLLRVRNALLHPVGVGEKRGRLSFSVPLQASGAPSAGQAHLGQRNNDREGRARHVPGTATTTVECEVVTLDELFPETNVPFIKLDIEGAELYALKGAQRLIERCKPTIVCEINPWFLEGFGIKLEELTGFFEERGYRMTKVESPFRLAPVESAKVVEDNYVFVHGSRQNGLARYLVS